MTTENKYYLVVAAIVLVVLGVAGAFVAMLYGNSPTIMQRTETVPTNIPDRIQLGTVAFAPPAVDEAPPPIREQVVLGYNIMMNTHQYAPQLVGNKLDCRNCHFEGGRQQNTVSLVGAAAKYPRTIGDSTPEFLSDKIRACFERNLNGKSPSPDGPEMQALRTYLYWISQGVPVGSDISWTGLQPLRASRPPDGASGMKHFTNVCTPCHGPEGLGTLIAPPVWGNESFSDGSAMSEQERLAAFVYRFMPLDKPSLSPDQANDVAAFLLSRPRPHYATKPVSAETQR